MKEKRILFVLPWLPYPLISGGHQAIFNGIKAVSGYADIFLTYKASNKAEESLINEMAEKIGKCEVIPYLSLTPVVNDNTSNLHNVLGTYKHIRHNTKLLVKRLLGIKDRPIPIVKEPVYRQWANVIYPFDESFAMFVRNLAIEKQIDIVQCEMIRNVGIAYFLPSNIKKIFVHHELRTVRYKLESKDIEGEEAAKEAYLNFFEGCEVNALDQFDAVFTLSETDKEKLISSGVKTKVFTSSAVVSTQVIPNPKTDRYHTLSFIGTDSHSPNVVGIKWFLDNCWDSLIKEDSEYELQIIGSWSDSIINEIAGKFKNVSFTGFVPNLADTIGGTIMIVPITVGSGIRMKILEAASIGCPIVSTSIGAEGIPIKNEEDCYIADTPADFNSAIIKFKNPDIRQAFVAKAQQMVTKHYSFDAFSKERLNVYEQVLNS